MQFRGRGPRDNKFLYYYLPSYSVCLLFTQTMPSPRDPTYDETTSLLQEEPEGSAQSNLVKEPVYPRWIITVVLLCGGAVLFDLSNNLGEVAEVAILEDIVCRDYYAKSAVNTIISAAERCKIEPIQTEIALLNGWRETFETIPGEFIILGKRGVSQFFLGEQQN